MDSRTAQSVHNSPSMNVDWFSDDQWLTGNNKTPDRKTVDESDNSFGDWSDFKSSTTTQDAFSNSWKQAARPDNQTIDDNDMTCLLPGMILLAQPVQKILQVFLSKKLSITRRLLLKLQKYICSVWMAIHVIIILVAYLNLISFQGHSAIKMALLK